MSDMSSKAGEVAYTLATYVYLLADAGIPACDADLQAACDALRTAGQAGVNGDVEARGAALVAAVEVALRGDDVVDALTRWYGPTHVATSLGATRDERVQRARSYQFHFSLPWLAEIVDRSPDGVLRTRWLLVERATEVVACMDPYPWDDLDEELQLPVIEFLVKWELAGARSARWVPEV